MVKNTIISASKANSLFWLGRYEERVYITLHLMRKCYDKMIDGEMEDYWPFWQKFDPQGVYQTNDEFTLGMMYDDRNPSSVMSAQTRAMDNAILLREEIMSETLSYLEMSVALLKRCSEKQETNVMILQPVIDWSLAFWGAAEQRLLNHKALYIMMIGRNIENLDMLLRFEYSYERIAQAYDSVKHYSRQLPGLLDDHIESQLDKPDYPREIQPERLGIQEQTAGVCQSVSEGMKRYLYNYQTIVTFSEPVSAHAVMLRCQPAANAFQTIEQEHIIVSPDYWMNAGTDAFGNRILFGGASEPHTVFAYVSTGIVATETYFQKQRGENMFLYSQPSQLTQLNDAMREAALTDAGATTAEKARQLCHRVYEMMAYEPETTTVETPAEDAFSRQCGVCQDYAHLMIAFCRANGLPARYVNGFLEGTGQTHAWVEVFDGYSWQGYDPTHDRTLLQQGYVKIAHGRDSADCPVSRGMFRGQAVQQTQISVTLQEL